MNAVGDGRDVLVAAQDAVNVVRNHDDESRQKMTEFYNAEFINLTIQIR